MILYCIPDQNNECRNKSKVVSIISMNSKKPWLQREHVLQNSWTFNTKLSITALLLSKQINSCKTASNTKRCRRAVDASTQGKHWVQLGPVSVAPLLVLHDLNRMMPRLFPPCLWELTWSHPSSCLQLSMTAGPLGCPSPTLDMQSHVHLWNVCLKAALINRTSGGKQWVWSAHGPNKESTSWGFQKTGDQTILKEVKVSAQQSGQFPDMRINIVVAKTNSSEESTWGQPLKTGFNSVSSWIKDSLV